VPKCGNRDWSNALLYHGLIFHDLRRSAVRNLRKWGIDETEIMAVTGPKNRSMFARYSIVSERDMAEMFERAERARAAEQELLRLEADKAMREEVSSSDSAQVRAKVGTEPLPN